MTNSFTLAELGWGPFFQQQLTLEELEANTVARVISHHKSQLQLLAPHGETALHLSPTMPSLCVGDWIVIDQQGSFVRKLERMTLFSRKSPGSSINIQLLAANIDTVFLVMSLNHDFNLSRLERYLTLVNEAGAEPVVVLTKADLCNHTETLRNQVQQLGPLLNVVCVNALDSDSTSSLRPWCAPGKTLAVLGSSGVGKSSLLNTLLGTGSLATARIREDDSKGRHTTTARSLHVVKNIGLFMDTPGMRELQLSDVEEGLAVTFSDIDALIQTCRFTDCSHKNEPGCAILKALKSGELDERRLQNYQKISREQALNSASLAQRRAKDKALSKMYRATLAGNMKRKT